MPFDWSAFSLPLRHGGLKSTVKHSQYNGSKSTTSLQTTLQNTSTNPIIHFDNRENRGKIQIFDQQRPRPWTRQRIVHAAGWIVLINEFAMVGLAEQGSNLCKTLRARVQNSSKGANEGRAGRKVEVVSGFLRN